MGEWKSYEFACSEWLEVVASGQSCGSHPLDRIADQGCGKRRDEADSRRTIDGSTRLVEMLARGFFKAGLSLEQEREPVISLMRKYDDKPMSFADACLLRMSELFPDHRVFTLDSDFRFYRKSNRRVVPLLIPDGL